MRRWTCSACLATWRARALAEEAVAECTAVLGAAHANTLEAQHGLASHRRWRHLDLASYISPMSHSDSGHAKMYCAASE